MTHVKPLIILALLPLVLSEVISGSTPFNILFEGSNFLYILFIGYGLPIILIREYAVKYELSVTGLVLLGFMYGIYNEGLIAQTFTSQTLPLEGLYGVWQFAGIHVLWAVTISLWHAFASVVFPILFFHFLYPEYAEKNILTPIPLYIMSVLLLVVGALSFLSTGNVGTLFIFLIILLILAGNAFRRKSNLLLIPYIERKWKPYVSGILIGVIPLVFVVVISLTGGLGYSLLFVVTFCFIAHIIHSTGGLLRIAVPLALGVYTQSALVGAFALVNQNVLYPIQTILICIICFGAPLYLYSYGRKIKRNENRSRA